MSECLTDDTLALLLDRRLSGPELRVVHEHVDSCEGCRLLLAESARGIPFLSTVASAAASGVTSDEDALPKIGHVSQAASELPPKYTNIGAYRILHVLGEGGMGVVFAAVHTSIGRRVAIKVLHRRLSLDPEFRARFFNEARAVNLIQHPGIVGVFEFGELEDGGLYLVMEHSRDDRCADRGPYPKTLLRAPRRTACCARSHPPCKPRMTRESCTGRRMENFGLPASSLMSLPAGLLLPSQIGM